MLTEQIIDSSPDNSLLQIIFDELSLRPSPNNKKEYDNVMEWNRSCQVIYMLWQYESEVNNGGFSQYYINSSKDFYKHIPGALELIGASKFSALAKTANDIYELEYLNNTTLEQLSIAGKKLCWMTLMTCSSAHTKKKI